MNLVTIIIDTFRYDHLSANGNPEIQTPNLDRLAGRSWNFSRAFAASFPTIPNRTDTLTGRYGAPFHPWTPLDCDVPTIPEQVMEQEYLTQLIHDTPHLVNSGTRFDFPFHAWTPIRGGEVDRAWITDSWEFFDNWEYDPLFDGYGTGREPMDHLVNNHVLSRYVHTNRPRNEHADWNVARLFQSVSKFLEDNASRDNFFLWVDCFDPHEPWDAPPEFVTMYDDTPGYDGTLDPRSFSGYGSVRNHPELSKAARQRVEASYKAKVTFMDHWLGEFLDTLDETGLRENTAILLAGDHGTNLDDAPGRGFGKSGPPRQNEAHIPLLLDVPGERGGRCDALVQPQDYFATLANLVGASVPDDIESYDLLEVAREGTRPREVAISGSSVGGWDDADPEDVLFTVFDGEWCLSIAPDQEASDLRRLGEYEEVSDDNAAVVEGLQAAGIDEIARRGLDPALVEWLRSGGREAFPEDYRTTDTSPAPEGWRSSHAIDFYE